MQFEQFPWRYRRFRREVLAQTTTSRLVQESWTLFIPEESVGWYEPSGNFDVYERKIQRRVTLFGRHLGWWTLKRHRLHHDAGSGAYLAVACFGGSLAPSRETAFAAEGFGAASFPRE